MLCVTFDTYFEVSCRNWITLYQVKIKNCMKKFYFLAIILIVISCNDSKTFSLTDIKKGSLASNVSSVSLAGLSVSKIIDKFHEVASQLMFEGENRGNALTQILGNQLDISIQNANIAFKDQQNTLFEKLDQIEQSFFVQLNGIIDESKTSVDRAISILEITNLNLYELTNRLPFTKKNFKLYKQSSRVGASPSIG